MSYESEHGHLPSEFVPTCGLCIDAGADEAARRGHGIEAALTPIAPDDPILGPPSRVYEQEALASFTAQAAEREVQVRAVLTERVRAELQFRLAGEFLDPADGESMRRAAEVAVGVFVEWIHTPPVRFVTQVDGSESVRCNAVGQYGDRCGYPLGHASSHAALNAAGAPCIEWG